MSEPGLQSQSIFDIIRSLWRSRRFDFFLLMLAALFPIYKYSFSFVILVALSIVSIFLFYKSGRSYESPFKERVRYLGVSTGFYFLLIVSLTYTSDIEYGIRVIQHSLYLLVFPVIILCFVRINSKAEIELILFCFVLASFIYSIFMHFKFAEAGLYSDFKSAEFNRLPFRDVLMGLKTGSGHPTYVSIWYLFSVLFLVQYLIKSWDRLSVEYKIGLLAMTIYFFLSSILLSSRIALGAFIISLILLLYLSLRSLLIKRISIGLVLGVFVFMLFHITFLRARFIDELNLAPWKPPVGLQTNSTNIRIGIYQCAFQIFYGNYLIGVGVGDVQRELNSCYNQYDTKVYQEQTYNSHNSFLDISLATGLIGILSFVTMFLFHMVMSIKSDNVLFLVFLTFIVLCMLAENILSRNHGIVFYSLFSSLFMRLNLDVR